MRPIDLPFAVIVPTANRPEHLGRMLQTLAGQDVQPARVVIADRSNDGSTRHLIESLQGRFGGRLDYLYCTQAGAAVQRNEGLRRTTEPILVFLDDDIRLEPGCLRAMLEPLADDVRGRIGGVGAVNLTCHYGRPGRLTRWVLDRLDRPEPARRTPDRRGVCYAGRVVGPAFNLPPALEGHGPVSAVQWLASGCVAYRRQALEAARFRTAFGRYSLAEDVDLSLRVGRRWALVVAHGARFVHDPPATKAATAAAIGRREVTHRYFLMTEVLGRRGFRPVLQFAMLQMFQLAGAVKHLRLSNARRTAALWLGRLAGYGRILWGAPLVERRGARAGRVKGQPLEGGPWETAPPPLEKPPLVSLVVVTRNRRAMLESMLRQCRRQTYRPLEVLVLDDASEDGTAALVEERFPEVRLVRQAQSAGLIAARNAAFALARGRWIVSLDDDAWFVDPDGISRLIGVGQRLAQAAVVTANVFDPGRPLQPVTEAEPCRLVHTFAGGASAIRREVFQRLGGYRGFYRYGAEETDLALRLMEAGWWIVAVPQARVFHDKRPGRHDLAFTFQHGACNNLCNSLLNEPAVQAALRIPALLTRQAVFAVRRRCVGSLVRALGLVLRRLPRLWRQRQALEPATFRLHHRLSRRPVILRLSPPEPMEVAQAS